MNRIFICRNEKDCSMRSIVVREFGGHDVMNIEQVPIPEPDSGQVVVAMKAVGINPVDVYIRSGQYAKKPALPYTPGFDGAGIVESVGKGVKGFKDGDRVYVAGTLRGSYAEFALCDESQVHPLPKKVSYEKGAAIGVPYGVAYRALFHRAKAQPGQTVLIHGGTGGVGVAAIQLSRARGLTVIATAGSESGMKFLSELGAHHVLDHRSSEHFARVIEITGGTGVDVVLEMAAHVNLGSDLKVLGKGGAVVVVGNRGSVEIDARELMVADAAIMGVLLFNAGHDELGIIHSALVAGLENGSLDPVIGLELPLTESAKAHETLMNSRPNGKIVLKP